MVENSVIWFGVSGSNGSESSGAIVPGLSWIWWRAPRAVWRRKSVAFSGVEHAFSDDNPLSNRSNNRY